MSRKGRGDGAGFGGQAGLGCNPAPLLLSCVPWAGRATSLGLSFLTCRIQTVASPAVPSLPPSPALPLASPQASSPLRTPTCAVGPAARQRAGARLWWRKSVAGTFPGLPSPPGPPRGLRTRPQTGRPAQGRGTSSTEAGWHLPGSGPPASMITPGAGDRSTSRPAPVAWQASPAVLAAGFSFLTGKAKTCLYPVLSQPGV